MHMAPRQGKARRPSATQHRSALPRAADAGSAGAAAEGLPPPLRCMLADCCCIPDRAAVAASSCAADKAGCARLRPPGDAWMDPGLNCSETGMVASPAQRGMQRTQG